jgi:hypothetical protein
MAEHAPDDTGRPPPGAGKPIKELSAGELTKAIDYLKNKGLDGDALAKALRRELDHRSIPSRNPDASTVGRPCASPSTL